MTGMLAALSGANIIYGAGMLESGLTFSHAQLVMDNDIFAMIRKVMQGISVDDESLAVDLIHSVGIGGNFLTEEHTMKYMRTINSKPRLIDRRNRQGWEERGSKDMAQSAAEVACDILKNHKPDPLSPVAVSALRRIVEEAEIEFAEPTRKK